MQYDVIVVGAGPAGLTATIKCAREGYNVLLVESKSKEKSKPCGGILTPICLEVLKDTWELSIPHFVFSHPQRLKLFLVSPSGNQGYIKGYELLNINRKKFDTWLRSVAEKYSNLQFNTKFMTFTNKNNKIQIIISGSDGISRLETSYLIGADGVFSNIRRILYPTLKIDKYGILQEYWRAKFKLDYCFSMFMLNRKITPLYGYVIPKGNSIIIGLGVPLEKIKFLDTYMQRFKRFLVREFQLKLFKKERREIGFIPAGTVAEGKQNVILVGDAGGFCNPLSGEGIRFAIETGFMAASSIDRADEELPLISIYKEEIKDIKDLIIKLRKFTLQLDEYSRERFVEIELSRSYIV